MLLNSKELKEKYLLGYSAIDIQYSIRNSWRSSGLRIQTPALYELEQLISALEITEQEEEFRQELVFLRQQLKLREEYLKLSWEITESQNKRDEQEGLLKLKQHEIKKIKLVSFEEIL